MDKLILFTHPLLGTIFNFLHTIMTTITIDNKNYDLASLSNDAKAQLASVQFVDQELARLQAHAAALQTARNAYLQALKAALPVVGSGDTIQLSALG